MPRAPSQKTKGERVTSPSGHNSTKGKTRAKCQEAQPQNLGESSQGVKCYFKPRNRWEQHWYDELGPEIAKQMSPTDEQIKRDIFSRGYTEETFAEGLRKFHERWDALLELDNKPQARGFKPRPNKKETVQVIDLPGSEPLVIRFFDAGMQSFGQYGVDFYNLETEVPVNSPDGWVIHVIPEMGSMSLLCAGPLKSWEVGWGRAQNEIRAGEERFSVIEGALCQLDRPDMDPFLFEVPRRRREMASGMHIARARML